MGILSHTRSCVLGTFCTSSSDGVQILNAAIRPGLSTLRSGMDGFVVVVRMTDGAET